MGRLRTVQLQVMPVDREEQPSLDGPFTLVTPKGQSQVAHLETHTFPRLITGREEVQVLSVRNGIIQSQALRLVSPWPLIEKMLGER
ncbi:Scr1 family TA system antitoxin-like transcriptional regulator [Streptomyces xantholiticus]